MGELPSMRVTYTSRMDGKLGHAIADNGSLMRETVWS